GLSMGWRCCRPNVHASSSVISSFALFGCDPPGCSSAAQLAGDKRRRQQDRTGDGFLFEKEQAATDDCAHDIDPRPCPFRFRYL
ncbi:hypothetical protein NY536_22200, partial [Enterobacter hormaechei]|nr:hypothetical protein [Enterobacter hormaechei]